MPPGARVIRTRANARQTSLLIQGLNGVTREVTGWFGRIPRMDFFHYIRPHFLNTYNTYEDLFFIASIDHNRFILCSF